MDRDKLAEFFFGLSAGVQTRVIDDQQPQHVLSLLLSIKWDPVCLGLVVMCAVLLRPKGNTGTFRSDRKRRMMRKKESWQIDYCPLRSVAVNLMVALLPLPVLYDVAKNKTFSAE